jgi:hypothetical protein
MGFIPNNGTNCQTYLNLRLNRNEVVAELEKLTYNANGEYYIIKRTDEYTTTISDTPSDLYVKKTGDVYTIQAHLKQSSSGTAIATYFDSSSVSGWVTFNMGVGVLTVVALSGYAWTDLQPSSVSNPIGEQNSLLTNLINTEKFVYKQPDTRFYGQPIPSLADKIEKIYVNTKLSDEQIKNLFVGIINDAGLQPNASTPILLSSMTDSYAGTMGLEIASNHTNENPNFSLWHISFGYRMDMFYNCTDGFINCYPDNSFDHNQPNVMFEAAIATGFEDPYIVNRIYDKLSIFLSTEPFEEHEVVTNLSQYLEDMASVIRTVSGTDKEINAQDFLHEISKNSTYKIGHHGLVELSSSFSKEVLREAVTNIIQQAIDAGVTVYMHNLQLLEVDGSSIPFSQPIKIHQGSDMPFVYLSEGIPDTIYSKPIIIIGIKQES